MSAGAKYDTAGARTVVDLAAERAATARAAAEAEQLRKREAAMQAEQQFRASLQTMNPGQLFAKADELKAQGDRPRAREAQRALMGRFPDHPLAATTARQMAGELRESTPGNVNSSTSDRGRLSAQACEAMKRTVMTTRVPPNASVTASTETVMFVTKTVLDMTAGGCPTDGTTSAQIEAERQERQRQYAAAESACNAVQSGGRRCVPQAHPATGAADRPPMAPAMNSAQQGAGSQMAYDPVTSRCLPVDSCECRQTCGVPRSSSGGGGIRTAR